MSSIPLSDLEPGSRLAYDLRDPDGRLLLTARRPISEDVLRALHRRKVSDLIFREAGELGEDGPTRTWLMAGVAEVGESIAAHAPLPIIVPSNDTPAAPAPASREDDPSSRPSIAHVRASLRRAADEVIAARTPRWNRLSREIETSGRPPIPRTSGPFGAGPTLSDEARRERIELVDRVFARLSAGEPVGMGVVAPIIDELADDAGRDPLATVRSAIEIAARTDDLATHAFAVASVCAVVAHRLGWTGADIRSAALAGLLADCGQTLLQWDIRGAPRPLTDVETNALHRHPAWSGALIELLDDDAEHSLDETVQLAVYQHHEREDGTGYPTRARAGAIHDLARVVAVADIFVGLLSPRAHRPGMSVESALAEVVRAASGGSLSRPIARGLVLALGLEPSTSRAPAVFTRTPARRIAA